MTIIKNVHFVAKAKLKKRKKDKLVIFVLK